MKKNILHSCLHWKVLFGVGAVILLAYFFMPNIAQYSWILLVLVCPLSMMFMMKQASDTPEKVFACSECGMSYKDVELAKKCAAWCKEHRSCNLEITKHAIK